MRIASEEDEMLAKARLLEVLQESVSRGFRLENDEPEMPQMAYLTDEIVVGRDLVITLDYGFDREHMVWEVRVVSWEGSRQVTAPISLGTASEDYLAVALIQAYLKKEAVSDSAVAAYRTSNEIECWSGMNPNQ